MPTKPPREPDRFEAKARDAWDASETQDPIAVIAAALRAAEAEAMERGAQVAEREQAEYWRLSREADRLGDTRRGATEAYGSLACKCVAERIRALASPESPPAKVAATATCVDCRGSGYRGDGHGGRTVCTECNGTGAVIRGPHAEPVAPAPSAAEKRIAELGRLLAQARDWLEFMAAHPGDGDAKNLIASIDAALSRTASPGKEEG